METIFDNYKGIVLFYLVIAILSLLYVVRINTLNTVATTEENSYYAYNN